ncbi:CmcI family methyltransferase [Myxococcota bacterium]
MDKPNLVFSSLLGTVGFIVGSLVFTFGRQDPPASPQPAIQPTASDGLASASAAPVALTDEQVITRFHQIWYDTPTTWPKNRWWGIPTMQNPLDSWITQEIISETKPDIFVECGSFHGGSAALWAMVLSQVNPGGRVISIDIEDKMAEARKLPIVRERVEFLVGSSTAPEIVAKVKQRVQGKRVLVLLDSDHRKAHVLNELKAYSPLVQVGDYLIVQDTNINNHPVNARFGPGPWEAVEEFLRDNRAFRMQRSRERLLMTFAPRGYLKRVQ